MYSIPPFSVLNRLASWITYPSSRAACLVPAVRPRGVQGCWADIRAALKYLLSYLVPIQVAGEVHEVCPVRRGVRMALMAVFQVHEPSFPDRYAGC